MPNLKTILEEAFINYGNELFTLTQRMKKEAESKDLKTNKFDKEQERLLKIYTKEYTAKIEGMIPEKENLGKIIKKYGNDSYTAGWASGKNQAIQDFKANLGGKK